MREIRFGIIYVRKVKCVVFLCVYFCICLYKYILVGCNINGECLVIVFVNGDCVGIVKMFVKDRS